MDSYRSPVALEGLGALLALMSGCSALWHPWLETRDQQCEKPGLPCEPAAPEPSSFVWRNPLPQGNTLRGIWGIKTGNSWAVGDLGTFRMSTGTIWSTEATNNLSSIYGVAVVNGATRFAVGRNGVRMQWDGRSTLWRMQPQSKTSNPLNAVWGTATNNVWAGGEGGVLLKWNGSGWVPKVSGTNSTIFDIWGKDPVSFWIVGRQGTVLQGQP